MSELKPCPFCGMDDHAELVEDGSGGFLGAYVKCHNCNARGPLHMFFPPGGITGRLYLHNENIHENREDVVPVAFDDWNSRFERTCKPIRRGTIISCGACGSELHEPFRFCGRCGARVVES